MEPGSQRTRFTGPALVRLLAQLVEQDAPAPKQAFAERLSQWLHWTDAVPLSAVLDGPAGPAVPVARTEVGEEEREFHRVRGALTAAIAADGKAAADDAGAADFSAHRRRYQQRQQAMAARIAPLRERLRQRLAAASPVLAQLAGLDAVLEQALQAQEQHLLGGIPALLEKRFLRLRQAAVAQPADDWQAGFRGELQAVLLAELDLRLQPAEGLLETLRGPQPTPPI